MSPAVSSSTTAIGTRPVDSVATLAELSKQVQTLRRKLAKASEANTPPPANDQSVTISSAIVSVQAQIERIMLEAQLTKLAARASAGSSVTDSQAAAAVSRPKDATGTKPNKLAAVAARYQATEPKPKRLDEKA